MAIPPILCYVMCTSYVHMHERVRTCSWISVEACRQCCLCSLHACFPLLICQKSSGLIVKSIWLVLGLNPSWLLNFFFVDWFLTLSAKTFTSTSVSNNISLWIPTSGSMRILLTQYKSEGFCNSHNKSRCVHVSAAVFFFFQKVVPKYNIHTNNNY